VIFFGRLSLRGSATFAHSRSHAQPGSSSPRSSASSSLERIPTSYLEYTQFLKMAAPHLRHTSECRSITSSKHAHTTVQMQHSRMQRVGLPVLCQAVNYGQYVTDQHQQQQHQHKQPMQRSWPLPCTHHRLYNRKQHCARQPRISTQVASVLVWMATCALQIQVSAWTPSSCQLGASCIVCHTPGQFLGRWLYHQAPSPAPANSHGVPVTSTCSGL
jgi:hypothetical protein